MLYNPSNWRAYGGQRMDNISSVHIVMGVIVGGLWAKAMWMKMRNPTFHMVRTSGCLPPA